MFVFNIYSSLLLPAVIQCFLFVALTARRYWMERKQSDLFLALLLLFTGIKLSFWMLGFAGWYDSHDAFTTFMFYFPFSAYLLSGPLMLFYFKSLTNSSFKIGRKDWPHLLLPVLFTLLIIGKFALDFLIYYPFPRQAEFQFGTRGPFAEADKSNVVSLLGFISFFFYLMLILKSFPAYRRYIQENFSDTGFLEFTWLKNMVLALFSGVFILFGFKMIELLNGGITYKTDWYGYAALAVISYYICINGYYIPSRQLYQLEFQKAETLPAKQTEKALQDPGDEEWLQTIKSLMEIDKPYLQPELSLATLAEMLGTNKSVLSRVINQYYQQNFNDFINQARVNQIIKQINSGKHQRLSLLGIAYDCGFNSKATFNRSFKKITGLTPQDYIRKNYSPAD